MAVLSAMSCPVCGAPITDLSSRCSYCGSIVIIQSNMPRLDARLLNQSVINENIARFRAAVRADVNDETAHYGLGIAYFNLGLINEASDELSQAARLMPENPNIQIQLAITLAELERGGNSEAGMAARDRLKRARLLDPHLLEGYLLDADFMRREGRWEDAVKAWTKAHSIEPDSIRSPIARFLSNYRDIIESAPQFAQKRSSWFANRNHASQANAAAASELQQFLSGTITDSSRMIGAAEFLAESLTFRELRAQATQMANKSVRHTGHGQQIQNRPSHKNK